MVDNELFLQFSKEKFDSNRPVSLYSEIIPQYTRWLEDKLSNIVDQPSSNKEKI